MDGGTPLDRAVERFGNGNDSGHREVAKMLKLTPEELEKWKPLAPDTARIYFQLFYTNVMQLVREHFHTLPNRITKQIDGTYIELRENE